MNANLDDTVHAADELAVPDDATMIEGVDDYFVFHVRPRPDVLAIAPEGAADGQRPAAC